MANSPGGSATPTVAGKKMSSALREKLKRCGRYHSSPVSSKRLCRKSPPVDSPLSSLNRGDNPMSQERLTPATSKTSCKVGPNITGNQITRCANHTMSNVDSRIMESPENTNSDRKDKTFVSDETSQRKFPPRGTHLPESPLYKNYNTPQSVPSRSCTTPKSVLLSTPQNLRIPSSQRSTNSKGVRLTFDSPHVESTFGRNGVEELSSEAVPHTAVQDAHGSGSLLQHRSRIQQLVNEKKESLRKLNMVKMYRTKNDLEQLEHLITKWRSVTQEGLQDLHEKMPDPKPTLTQLINHLQIDYKLIGYDPEEESFD